MDAIDIARAVAVVWAVGIVWGVCALAYESWRMDEWL